MRVRHNGHEEWIYYQDQCDYCISDKTGCSYHAGTQELLKALRWLDANVRGAYGSLDYKCDYFRLNDDKLKSERECVTNGR